MLLIARVKVKGPEEDYYRMIIFDSQWYTPELVRQNLTNEKQTVEGFHYATDVLGGEVEIWVPSEEEMKNGKNPDAG